MESSKVHRSVESDEFITDALKAFLQTTDDFFFVKDADLVYRAASDNMAKLVGLPSGEAVIGKTDFDIFPKDLAEKYRWDDQRVMESGTPLQGMVERLPDVDGEKRWTRTRKFPLFDAAGNLIGTYGSSHDVTHEIQLEEEAESARTYVDLVGNLPGGIAFIHIQDGEAYLDYANEGFDRVHHFHKPERNKLLGRPLIHNVYEKDRDRVFDTVRRAIVEGDGRGTIDYRVCGDDGRLHWVNVQFKPSEAAADHYYASYTDVDQQKNAEEAEAANATLYELAIKCANLAVWEYDIATKRLIVPENEMGKLTMSRYGFTTNVVENVPESMLPMGLRDEDRAKFMRLFDEVRAGKEYVTADVWFRLSESQEPRCERLSYYVEKDEAGVPVKAFGIGNDITAQEKEREQFQRSLRAQLTANPDALCLFPFNLTQNACGEGQGVSPYITKMLQSPTVDGLFANFTEMIVEDDVREDLHRKLNRETLLAEFSAGQKSLSAEYRRWGEGGKPFWARTYLTMLQNPETQDVEGIVYSIDISKVKQEEEILNIITSEAYDLIALLHTDTGQFEAVFVGDTLPESYRAFMPAPGAMCDFSELCNTAADSWVAEDETEEYRTISTVDYIKQRLSEEGNFEFTARRRFSERPDGWMIRRYQHYLMDDDQVVLIIESDVTKTYRQQQREIELAKAEAERVTDILGSISGGISVLHMPDADHLSFEYVNNQLYRMLGFEPLENNAADVDSDTEKLIAAYFGNAFVGVHPDDRARVKKTFHDNFESEQFVVDDYRTLGKDGRFIWLREVVTLREVTPEYRVFYALYQDVGEEVRLRGEIEQQLVEEKRLRIEAINANASKSEFLSRMSHDIRTPMNGIIGMTRIAREQENPPKTVECLDKIDTSSRFLLGLVNDILDISKVESGAVVLHPEPYQPGKFLSYLDAVIRPQCEQKGIEFLVHTDLVEGMLPIIDELRANQIVFNLLSNAVKFTPEGGTISVSLVEKMVDDGRIHLKAVVSDTGIGMSKEFMGHLFEPFVQESAHISERGQGTGLGLTIVKRMVDLMGGTIEVHSEQGKGTTFTIEGAIDCTQVADEAPRGAEPDPGAALKLAGKRALLVEDHPLNTEIAVQMLNKLGMIVTTAEDGKRGLDAFSVSPKGYYDIVLMDLRMPVMDGYEAAQAIRALDRPDAASIPIVAMSADAYDDDIEKTQAAGMNAHIAKPVDPDKLRDVLTACCL